jgi:hypothetical protein
MASGTDGEILTYDASGNPTSVSVGTDGQVLTSTGAGSPPAFEAAAAGGKVVNTWAIGSSGGAVTIANTSSYSGIGCSGSISVTAGNKLLVQLQSGMYGASGMHYSMNVYFNSSSLGNGSWGAGISHGNVSYGGWDNKSALFQTTVSTTGTYTIEVKANCNSGSIKFQRDGTTASGWGYDCAKMIVWEVET